MKTLSIVLALLATISVSAEPLQIGNDQISVTFSVQAGQEGQCQFGRPSDNTTVLKKVCFGEVKGADISQSIEKESHCDWGNGRTVVQQTVEGETRISVYEGFPFAVINKKIMNKTNTEIVVDKLNLFDGEIGLGLPNEKLRSASTAGLYSLNNAIGSYAYMAIGDPETNRGIVCGWLTHDRGSGIVFTEPEGNRAMLRARIDYGDLRIPAGAEVKTETLLVGYFEDVRRGLEFYADALADHYDVQLPQQPVFYMTWYDDDSHATNENRILENAEFIKEHLTPYGLDVMQIDSGWQGGGGANSAQRYFGDVNPKTYPSGMKVTADRLHAMGLRPGIWYIPFAGTWYDPIWSDRHDLYLKQGSSPYNNSSKKGEKLPYEAQWGGTCIDLTNSKSLDYVRFQADLLSKQWGYKFLKLDGLWTGTGTRFQYANTKYEDDDLGMQIRKNPSITPIEAYRNGLKTIRETAGDDVFLLGCCAPQNMRSYGGSFGLVDAMRVGPDNGAGRKANSIITAVVFASRNFWQNKRLWYVDPDSFSIRDSVDLTMTRSYFSWITLCGMLSNTSVNYADLSLERLDYLRRTMPSHSLKTVNPVDFLEREPARIWTLKDTQAGPERMVIGLFNWGTKEPVNFDISFEKLGLDPTKQYIGFDYWGNTFIHPFTKTLKDSANPMDCRILSIKETKDYPQVLGTSRHITQGSVDLLEESWDPCSLVLSGRSLVVAEDPYELRIAVPWKKDSLKAINAEFMGISGHISQDGPKIRVIYNPKQTGEVSWSIRFKKSKLVASPFDKKIKGLKTKVTHDAVDLSWEPVENVKLKLIRRGNGETLMIPIGTKSDFQDRLVKLGQTYNYSVVGINWMGKEAELASVEVQIPAKLVTPPLPSKPDIALTELKWLSANSGWDEVRLNQTVTGKPLLLDGVEYKNGIGTHAKSVIVYDIPEGARRFVSLVGIDDRMRGKKTGGSVQFRVIASVREMGEEPVLLGESPVLDEKTIYTWAFDLDLNPRFREIRLEVDPADKGINSDHANWCNPGFMK